MQPLFLAKILKVGLMRVALVTCFTQRLADRIKHVPTSIRTTNTIIREQPPRMYKSSNSKMKSDSAIGQHLITNLECAKTCTEDNFRINGQARSSFHLSVLESVYIKTQNPVLCKQKRVHFLTWTLQVNNGE